MKQVLNLLKKLKINHELHQHPAVYTCDEADKYYKNIEGGKSKNLFIRNKKGDKHYLIIIESNKKVDLKSLATTLNESKLSFASEERLMKYLGLTKGSVSPFGLINDINNEVVVVLDQDLLKNEKLHYHPNVNTATVELSKDNFIKFLDWTGNQYLSKKL